MKKFKKSDLLEVLDCPKGQGCEGLTHVETKFVGKKRWSIEYQFVFAFDGKFYMTYYSVGSTESQDESPWEYAGDEIECTQVEPVIESVTVYKRISV